MVSQRAARPGETRRHPVRLRRMLSALLLDVHWYFSDYRIGGKTKGWWSYES